MGGYGVALVACFAALVHLSAAAKYTVGGSTGWGIPTTTSFYSNWAAKQTFKVGDVLAFNFQTGSHTVAEVSKSDYDACTTTNPITKFTTGPATVSLATAGAHYYICTIPGHCSTGQKLAITAAAAAAPKSSPAPAPSKTTVSAPSASPATAPAPASLSPATAPSPSSGSPVTAPSPAPTPAATPTSAPAPAPFSAATPTSAPVPAPSSGGSSPATSPASGATSPASSTAPSTKASPAGGPSSSTTPSSPSSGTTAAAGSVLSILLISAAFLF